MRNGSIYYICMLILFFSVSTKANLIDVDIYGNGQYSGFSLDNDGYQLDWLDFGINNNQSYNQVKSGLQNNWRIATESEVTFLWRTLFLNKADEAKNTGFGNNGFAAATAKKWQGNYALWLSYNAIIGKNHVTQSNSIEALGWFEADNGNLTAASYWIIDDTDGEGSAKLDNSYNGRDDLWENKAEQGYSTFVVREKSINVPEPTSLILLTCSFLILFLSKRT